MERARLSQHKNVHIISLTDARALHADSRIHTKEGAILVEMILLVKNLLGVIATDFASQIIVSIIDNVIRITFDIHAIIRVLSSIRIFSSAFYPPSAFSHPRFILHPHFLIRVLSSIRIFSSAFYPPSAFSHPRFILHPHFLIRVLSSIRISHPRFILHPHFLIRIFSSAIRIRHPYPHPYPRFIPTPIFYENVSLKRNLISLELVNSKVFFQRACVKNINILQSE